MTQRATRRKLLSNQVQDVHEEARMVLPGVQALFGFQLIAAFSERFAELSFPDNLPHFIAPPLAESQLSAKSARILLPRIAGMEWLLERE